MSTRISTKLPNKINNIIDNPTFILSIVSKIEKTIRREILDTEIDLIVECSKKLPSNVFNLYEVNEIMDIVSNTVISEIQLINNKSIFKENC